MHTTRDFIAGSRVLVIDSDDEDRHFIEGHLAELGVTVRAVADGIDGMKAALAIPRPDLIITELGLAKLAGPDFLRRLRRRGNWVPVIIACRADDDCAHQLAIDAEVVDIMTKPFSAETLQSRVTATLRRVMVPRCVFRYADLSLNLATRCATRGDREMKLTPSDTELLLYFMQQPEVPVSSERLLQEVWGGRLDPRSQAHLPRISRLRQKLHGSGEVPILLTVPSMGYMLALPDPEDGTLEGIADIPWPGSLKDFATGDC